MIRRWVMCARVDWLAIPMSAGTRLQGGRRGIGTTFRIPVHADWNAVDRFSTGRQCVFPKSNGNGRRCGRCVRSAESYQSVIGGPSNNFVSWPFWLSHFRPSPQSTPVAYHPNVRGHIHGFRIFFFLYRICIHPFPYLACLLSCKWREITYAICIRAYDMRWYREYVVWWRHHCWNRIIDVAGVTAHRFPHSDTFRHTIATQRITKREREISDFCCLTAIVLTLRCRVVECKFYGTELLSAYQQYHLSFPWLRVSAAPTKVNAPSTDEANRWGGRERNGKKAKQIKNNTLRTNHFNLLLQRLMILFYFSCTAWYHSLAFRFVGVGVG